MLKNTVNKQQLITSIEALEACYPAPRRSSTTKVQSCLTAPMTRWLSHSSFFVLSSVGDSALDCSPRGDRPGEAFRVLDDKTIAIPDRRGNNRIETLKNILKDSRVGLVFIIPGIEEALRVKGRASISIEPELLELFTLSDMPPATVMLINVESAYVQNARAIRAAALWNDKLHVSPSDLPTIEELYNSVP